MINIAILGAKGAIGSALFKYYNSHDSYNATGIDAISDPALIHLDMLNQDNIEVHFRKNNYQIIINCIGSYSNSFSQDLLLNVTVSHNLLEVMRKIDPDNTCQIILLGSSAEYGKPTVHDGKISEDHPLNPINPYGLTKKMQYDLFLYYRERFQSNLLYVRPFNIISKQLSSKLFIGNFYKQIQEYKEGMITQLEFGYLGNYRDYIDLNVFCNNLETISQYADTDRVFNLGSGTPIKMFDLLNQLIEKSSLTKKPVINYQKEPNRIEVEYLYADMSRFQGLSK